VGAGAWVEVGGGEGGVSATLTISTINPARNIPTNDKNMNELSTSPK
jgi:hypothetical protein